MQPVEESICEKMKKGIQETLRQEKEGENVEVSLSFVTKEEIQELNRTYRGKDQVTDVLSFPQDDFFPHEMRILGDVVICVERAKEQAGDYGHSIERELVYLTVHSTLHLLGYDHMIDADKREMRTKEKNIMDKLSLSR
ncbi:MAG TPA: rRNA maturation RNase YbeY [Eubacteriaceae bacterium]|nr:rRNA maturation RNase YbeY [Eubacteriaceae bacterium]